MSLHRKYRPKTLDDVVGQDAAVRSLKGKLGNGGVPHAVLLTGPRGTGKTSTARILARGVGCDPKSGCEEVNCGTLKNPIAGVRRIQAVMNLYPLVGKSRAWILDEVGALSRARFAQEGLLKILEEPPDHAYFFLCTTDPQKLTKTIIDRCTPVHMKLISERDLHTVLDRVCVGEGLDGSVSAKVRERLVECADGSARRVLVLLEQVMHLKGEKEQLRALVSDEVKKQATDLARLLIFKKPRWGEVKELLKALADQDPETVRRVTLAYARTVMLGDQGQKFGAQCASVISCFSDNFYNTEHAGLALAAWDACQGK